MRLLLDTHIAIWAAINERNLTEGERAAIAATTPVISAVSIWEARLKWQSFYASGDRKGVIAPDQLLAFALGLDWAVLPLTVQHGAATLQHPSPHGDPFDELLLVQAQEEKLKLLTRDSKMIGHPLALVVSRVE